MEYIDILKMEEENKETPTDKYIKCSKCNCKYNNDEDSIKTNFGYTRLNERYKTCCKCRNKHKQYQRLQCVKEQRKERESETLTCPHCNRNFPKSSMYQHRRSHDPALWANKK